jgi:hypothetical protein
VRDDELTRPSRVLSAEERMNSTDPFDIVDMCREWNVVEDKCDSIYMNSTQELADQGG